MEDWEEILLQWITEAEVVGDYDRAAGMRTMFNIIYLADRKKN